ncbi:hypothetical protein D3C73_1581340 [compost metagenome]
MGIRIFLRELIGIALESPILNQINPVRQHHNGPGQFGQALTGARRRRRQNLIIAAAVTTGRQQEQHQDGKHGPT